MSDSHRYWLQLVRGPRIVDDQVFYDRHYREIFTSRNDVIDIDGGGDVAASAEPRLFTLTFGRSRCNPDVVKKYVPILLSRQEIEAIDEYTFATWCPVITGGSVTVHLLRLTADRLWQSLPTLVISRPARIEAFVNGSGGEPPARRRLFSSAAASSSSASSSSSSARHRVTPTNNITPRRNDASVTPRRLLNDGGNNNNNNNNNNNSSHQNRQQIEFLNDRVSPDLAAAMAEAADRHNANSLGNPISLPPPPPPPPRQQQRAAANVLACVPGPSTFTIHVQPQAIAADENLAVILRRVGSNFNRGNIYLRRRPCVLHEYFVFNTGPPIGESVSLTFGRSLANFRRIPAPSTRVFRQAYKFLNKEEFKDKWIPISGEPNNFSIFRPVMPDKLHSNLILNVAVMPLCDRRRRTL